MWKTGRTYAALGVGILTGSLTEPSRTSEHSKQSLASCNLIDNGVYTGLVTYVVREAESGSSGRHGKRRLGPVVESEKLLPRVSKPRSGMSTSEAML